MKEAFLQFIWQFQLYKKQDLKLSSGEIIDIIHPGILNDHSGPDFLQGHIQYDDLNFHGNIEIHLRSSEWYKHGHQDDEAYNNVILHVVLEEDKPVKDFKNKDIPCLILKGRIPLNYYKNYENLIANSSKLACENQISKVNTSILMSMMDRVLNERLEMKSDVLLELYNELGGDWEELSFKTIVKSFGFKRNKHGFEALSERLSFLDIKRHCTELIDVEALLFGMAGFLNSPNPNLEYYEDLRKRFLAIQNKGNFKDAINPVVWKFFRLRPANFPTVRIAQLAAFIHNNEHLFSELKEFRSLSEIRNFLQNHVSDFWRKHYKFSKETAEGTSEIGQSSIESIAINAIIPLWYAYGKHRANDELTDRSFRLLEVLAPENNKITRYWKDLEIPNNSAFDSQALIQMYNSYCVERNCLKCNVGVTLVREF